MRNPPQLPIAMQGHPKGAEEGATVRIQLIEPNAATIGAAAVTPTASEPTVVIPVGVQVELRSRFDDRWTNGFAIAVCGDGEYQVRRLSDGHVLPAWFPAAVLRPILES